jgi:hypothetical protein
MNVAHLWNFTLFGFGLSATSKHLTIAGLYTRPGSPNDFFGSSALVEANSENNCGCRNHAWGGVSKYHRIQIADFGPNRLDLRENAATARRVGSEPEASEMRPDEKHIAKIGIFSFALILFEIVVDLSALGRTKTSEEFGKLLVNACEKVEIPGFHKSKGETFIQ